MTLIKCPDCEHGKVEMEVGRSYGGDFITAWDTCPTCKGAGEIEVKICVCGHSKNDHHGAGMKCYADDDCECTFFTEEPLTFEVMQAENKEPDDEQPMCQGVFNRYNAEQDAGKVTWADYQMAEAIVRLQSRIIKLEKIIDKLTELQF